MRLILERFAYTPTETQGVLLAGNDRFYTIERPWIQGPYPGGMSFESCIPDGNYKLKKHVRPSGDKVVALVNPRLGVWYQEWDRPNNWGRYLILLHSANVVSEVVGCIAPGLWRTIYNNQVMVTNSRAAMVKLKVQKYDSITIRSTLGAQDKAIRT